jgi:hypothetical protein
VLGLRSVRHCSNLTTSNATELEGSILLLRNINLRPLQSSEHKNVINIVFLSTCCYFKLQNTSNFICFFRITCVLTHCTLIVYYTFRSFSHHQICTFNVGCIAQLLHWPMFTVGIFCVVGLIYWGVMLL